MTCYVQSKNNIVYETLVKEIDQTYILIYFNNFFIMKCNNEYPSFRDDIYIFCSYKYSDDYYDEIMDS